MPARPASTASNPAINMSSLTASPLMRALVEAQQMWRRIKSDPVSSLHQYRFQHDTGRSLAVGAANSDHRTFEVNAELCLYRDNAVQDEVDCLGMHRFQRGQPFVQRSR